VVAFHMPVAVVAGTGHTVPVVDPAAGHTVAAVVAVEHIRHHQQRQSVASVHRPAAGSALVDQLEPVFQNYQYYSMLQ